LVLSRSGILNEVGSSNPELGEKKLVPNIENDSKYFTKDRCLLALEKLLNG
jgi:hypothetical protein